MNVPRPANARSQHVLALAQPSHGQAEFVSSFVECVTADVAERDPLEPPPDPLVRIQLWCIARQRQQLQTLGATSREEALDFLAAMNQIGRASCRERV